MQARAQQDVLGLLRDSILPRTEESLDLARSDYAKGNVDYATVLSALREVLQVQLQIAQVEAELGKALAVPGAGRRLPDQRAPPGTLIAGSPSLDPGWSSTSPGPDRPVRSTGPTAIHN